MHKTHRLNTNWQHTLPGYLAIWTPDRSIRRSNLPQRIPSWLFVLPCHKTSGQASDLTDLNTFYWKWHRFKHSWSCDRWKGKTHHLAPFHWCCGPQTYVHQGLLFIRLWLLLVVRWMSTAGAKAGLQQPLGPGVGLESAKPSSGHSQAEPLRCRASRKLGPPLVRTEIILIGLQND